MPSAVRIGVMAMPRCPSTTSPPTTITTARMTAWARPVRAKVRPCWREKCAMPTTRRPAPVRVVVAITRAWRRSSSRAAGRGGRLAASRPAQAPMTRHQSREGTRASHESQPSAPVARARRLRRNARSAKARQTTPIATATGAINSGMSETPRQPAIAMARMARERLPRLSPARRTAHPGPTYGMSVTQMSTAVPSELLAAQEGLPEEVKDYEAHYRRQELTDRLRHVGPPLGGPTYASHSSCQGSSFRGLGGRSPLTSDFDQEPIKIIQARERIGRAETPTGRVCTVKISPRRDRNARGGSNPSPDPPARLTVTSVPYSQIRARRCENPTLGTSLARSEAGPTGRTALL